MFAYRESKLHAFNIINKISKINKTPPIIIDLSLSHWRKLNFYKPALVDLFYHRSTRGKLLMGAFLSFCFTFNARAAQIQLDSFTDPFKRGTIINGTTAAATLTVMLLLTFVRLKRYAYLTFLTPLAALASLIYYSI